MKYQDSNHLFPKRLLALLLVLSLLLPVFAFAADDDEDLEIEEIIDDEAGDDAFDLSSVSEENIENLAELYELDPSVDPGNLEINENLPDNVINILLIGLDVRGTSEVQLLSDQMSVGQEGKYPKRADVQMILSLNTDDGSIKLTSIARNTYVSIPGRKNKSLIANSFGHANYNDKGEYKSWTDTPETCIATVNHNFELNIKYYVAINFFGVVEIIEALGGVDLDLTAQEARAINTYLSMSKILNSSGEQVSHGKEIARTYDRKKGNREKLKKQNGVQHLDGLQALMYARLRKIDNDFVRTARTRHLLDCLLKQTMEKVKAGKLDILNLISDFIAYPVTNIDAWSVFELASKVANSEIMNHLDEVTTLISEFRVPEDGTYRYDTVNGSSVTVMKDHQKTTESIHEFIYGRYYPANSQE